jgi:cell wall-associated NlpC family hydrolase
MRGAGIGRAGLFLAAASVLSLQAVVGGAGVANAASSAPSTPTSTSTTLPGLPKVAPDVTDGRNSAQLLKNAIALSSLGIDSTALMTAVGATQAKMDADSTLWQKSTQQAAAADSAAHAALAAARSAQGSLGSMADAVKKAAVQLYVDGGSTVALDPRAGELLLYAPIYMEATTSPWGVLARQQSTVSQRNSELARAARLQRAADAAAGKAREALEGERVEAGRLQAELSSMSSASAAAVLADHETLSTQVGQELLSTASLQFTPKKPLPPPLSTTPVALTWAFAELGKPYVWGATGPNSFDCSGLTQFVWRQAGVTIPRVAADQDAWTIPVPLSELLPGDLVFYGTTDIHHVGIYIGDGLMINAPHTGDVVRVTSIWWSDLAGFGRVHAPGTPIPLHAAPTIGQPAVAAVIPTAGPVPSQTKPPPGWKPTPGSTTPIDLGSRYDIPTTTTTTSTSSLPTTSVSTTTTTLNPSSTTTSTSTTTTIPDSTTSSTDTTTTVASG